MKEGDVILECNGTKLEDPSDLQKIVIGSPIGTVLKLKVLRENKTIFIDIKTDKMPSEEKIEKSEMSKNLLGIKVRDLLPKEKKETFYKFGVVVVEVMPNSPADLAGIMEGDIIFTINQKQIKNSNDFKQIISSLKKGSIINIFLQRDNRTFYIAVRL